jgi:acyl-lipid omega-6 desaturase (Delta-12 desaturase)
MTIAPEPGASAASRPPNAAEWPRLLERFRAPANSRAVLELAITLIPFLATWSLAAYAVRHGMPWLAVPFILLGSALLVRLFLIQHDCGHRAFFRYKRANDWVGRALGVITLTPYEHWRRAHAIHHATHGNLERRGVGDVDTLTVAEYLARPWWGRLRYRLYRNPLVTFGIGPIYVFLLTNRFPAGFTRSGWRHWISTMGTNAAIVIVALILMRAVGAGVFVWVHAPIVLFAAAGGVWLFYVQHQFEHAYWAGNGAWNFHEAALRGSSHYVLPPVLRWFTANIGVHHVHHLASGIPFYRLPDVLRAHPSLSAVNRLTLRESFACASLALWDERERRMIRFADLEPRAAAPEAH